MHETTQRTYDVLQFGRLVRRVWDGSLALSELDRGTRKSLSSHRGPLYMQQPICCQQNLEIK
eukprot:6186757-Amphidinium_carterae.1